MAKTTKGKRRCPWCGRRTTLREGKYPPHVHPLGGPALCPGSFKPHQRRPKRPKPVQPGLPGIITPEQRTAIAQECERLNVAYLHHRRDNA